MVQTLEYVPRSPHYVYAYMNRPDVQEALHANVTKVKHDWQPCSEVITNWRDSPSTVLPLFFLNEPYYHFYMNQWLMDFECGILGKFQFFLFESYI